MKKIPVQKVTDESSVKVAGEFSLKDLESAVNIEKK